MSFLSTEGFTTKFTPIWVCLFEGAPFLWLFEEKLKVNPAIFGAQLKMTGHETPKTPSPRFYRFSYHTLGLHPGDRPTLANFPMQSRVVWVSG